MERLDSTVKTSVHVALSILDYTQDSKMAKHRGHFERKSQTNSPGVNLKHSSKLMVDVNQHGTLRQIESDHDSALVLKYNGGSEAPYNGRVYLKSHTEPHKNRSRTGILLSRRSLDSQICSN